MRQIFSANGKRSKTAWGGNTVDGKIAAGVFAFIKKYLRVIIINGACLTGILICQIISTNITAPLHAGRAVKTWAGSSGERFASFSVHFPQDYVFDDEKIFKLHAALDNALLAASMEAGEGRVLYNDAWSAQGEVSVTGLRGSATVPVIGVGGDFFLFHPLNLRSGSYITSKDIMRDRVVIDEELAWRLYGSVHLAGLEVIIAEKPFVIAGVVSREPGFAYEKAYSGGAGMYMSIEALQALSGDPMNSSVFISSYEIVMPDLVTDFAFDILKNTLGDDSLHLINNTDRFGFSRLLSIITSFGMRSMREDAVFYPYWENAYRFAEDWVALLFFISFLLLICPAVFLVFYMVRLIRFGLRSARFAAKSLLKKRDDRHYRRYKEKQINRSGP